jgi:hypothetical protein
MRFSRILAMLAAASALECEASARVYFQVVRRWQACDVEGFPLPGDAPLTNRVRDKSVKVKRPPGG